MKTSSNRKMTKTLGIAAALLVGLTIPTVNAAEKAAVKTAVRPASEATANYGYPDYSQPTQFGNQFGTTPTSIPNQRPFTDYSQPNEQYVLPSDFNAGWTGQQSNGQWGNVLPSGNMPVNNWSGDYLTRYPQQTAPASSNPGSSWPGYTQPQGQTFPGWNSTPSYNPTPSYQAPVYNQPTNVYPTNTYPVPTNVDPRYQPTPALPVQPVPAQVNEVDLISRKITARYQNPEMLGFLQRMSVNHAMNLYVETSKLIDSRHVSPVSYEARTRRAMEGLGYALENSAFLQAAGGRADANQVRALQQELRQLAETNAPRSANEAIGLMQFAADLANQRLGVRREAVALEFFNSSLDSLDKYTAFVPNKAAYGAIEQEELQTAALEEQIVGVGVELKTHERGAIVLGTVENSPARRAGLVRGDVVTGIDGRSIAGLSIAQAASYISGPAGSTVTFRVERNGQQFTTSLRRESIYVSSVAGAQMLNAETGYLRLKQFSESSAEDMEKAMWNLYRTGMRTLVLDLRGNPGGLLTESIQVSNLFIPAGRIVATKGRTASDDSDERATFDKTWRLPLVVLVDENSASASEIFAAAIQENRRGVIVGRNSYGKGTVQTHFPLQSVSGSLKLTTAKFYSPDGREMEGAGVRPDVLVQAQVDEIVTDNLGADVDVRQAMDVINRGLPAQLTANLVNTNR
ncbi:MAG: S41 family peptidase [Planctomycetaceae bacterium]